MHRMTVQEYQRSPLSALGWLGRRQESGSEDPPAGAFRDDPTRAELAELDRDELKRAA